MLARRHWPEQRHLTSQTDGEPGRCHSFRLGAIGGGEADRNRQSIQSGGSTSHLVLHVLYNQRSLDLEGYSSISREVCRQEHMPHTLNTAPCQGRCSSA